MMPLPRPWTKILLQVSEKRMTEMHESEIVASSTAAGFLTLPIVLLLWFGMSKQDVNCYFLYIASNWAALGICYNSGQDCTAGSRVYVQETIYDKFLDLLVQKVKAQTIGDGFDEQSGGGPVVSAVFYFTDPIFCSHQNSRSLKASMNAYGAISTLENKKGLNLSLEV